MNLKKPSALVLLLAILSTMCTTSIKTVYADYQVPWASLPPDLKGDINADGKVDIFDAIILANAFGSSFGTNKWDVRCDTNDDGTIDLFDAMSINSEMGHVYSTTAYPVAYSTDFRFEVPRDANNIVWYYMIFRVYIPSGQAGTYTLHVDELDDWIINVRIDRALKYGGSTSDDPCVTKNINLGNLNQGYHILEFSFVEGVEAGFIHFYLQSGSNRARIDRCRVCVPPYPRPPGWWSMEYVIRTTSVFMVGNWYLSGFATDYIKDIWIGGANKVWNNWMWDGGEYESLYGWGDGFKYPFLLLGDGEQSTSFTFGAYCVSGAGQRGLLDFRFISQYLQSDNVGKPVFYAKTTHEVGTGSMDSEITEKTFYAGSKWYGGVGASQRSILTEQDITFHAQYTDYWGMTKDFAAKVRLGIGVGWAWTATKEWSDFGIVLNLTYLSDVPIGIAFNQIYFDDVTADIYTPSQALHAPVLEPYNEGQNEYVDDWVIVMDATTRIMTSLVSVFDAPAGALVGITGTVISALVKHYAGTSESAVSVASVEDTHLGLSYAGGGSFIHLENPGDSDSHLLFVKMGALEIGSCGLLRVALHGKICYQHSSALAVWWSEFDTTICIPWFVSTLV